jgi:hypothetical protein
MIMQSATIHRVEVAAAAGAKRVEPEISLDPRALGGVEIREGRNLRRQVSVHGHAGARTKHCVAIPLGETNRDAFRCRAQHGGLQVEVVGFQSETFVQLVPHAQGRRALERDAVEHHDADARCFESAAAVHNGARPVQRVVGPIGAGVEKPHARR